MSKIAINAIMAGSALFGVLLLVYIGLTRDLDAGFPDYDAMFGMLNELATFRQAQDILEWTNKAVKMFPAIVGGVFSDGAGEWIGSILVNLGNILIRMETFIGVAFFYLLTPFELVGRLLVYNAPPILEHGSSTILPIDSDYLPPVMNILI